MAQKQAATDKRVAILELSRLDKTQKPQIGIRGQFHMNVHFVLMSERDNVSRVSWDNVFCTA